MSEHLPNDGAEDEWSPEFLATLGAWNEPIERPPSRPISQLRDPFD